MYGCVWVLVICVRVLNVRGRSLVGVRQVDSTYRCCFCWNAFFFSLVQGGLVLVSGGAKVGEGGGVAPWLVFG